uniref:Tyrosine hydroxylase 2 n=1 Tax=Cyprinus carpio TaxID=7962 RepID=A0A8C1ZTA4_CYPCA
TLNILFALKNEKNAGFFKAGKVFKVRAFTSFLLLSFTNYSCGDILFHGDPLPVVEYTPEEIRFLYPTHACRHFLEALGQLESECLYGGGQDPSARRKRTGFLLRPIAELLSVRGFLARLVFRVFQCTQYSCHPSAPIDCCHELLGLFCHPVNHLCSQYVCTILYMLVGLLEFGLYKQNGTLKAYGAGLLSLYGEPLPFNPAETAVQPYQDQSYQPVYFLGVFSDDLQYLSAIQKPFSIRYDPYTYSMEVLDELCKIQNALGQMRDDLKIFNKVLRQRLW